MAPVPEPVFLVAKPVPRLVRAAPEAAPPGVPGRVGVGEGVVQAIGVPVKPVLLAWPRLFNDRVRGLYFKERNYLQYTNFFFQVKPF